MNQQEDIDRVSDVIQFGQTVYAPRPLARQIFTAPASSAASAWACFQQGRSNNATRMFAIQQS